MSKSVLFRFCSVVLILTVPVGFLFSFNWPVADPIVTSTFGGNKWNTFGSGIEIYGNGLDVSPSADGEVLFYEDNSVGSVIPSGLGGFAVVEHARKLRTLYSSIDLNDGIEDFKSITTADVLGTAGISGKSSKPHLYFAVIDSEFEQYVNPLLLLSSIADNKPPVIREIGILNYDGYAAVDKKAVVNSGEAEILADIFDPCMSEEFFCPMIPFKIHLFLNGEEVFYVNFESLRSESGSAVVQSEHELHYMDFYKEDSKVSLGEMSLVPGDYRFEILVSDYSGNETGQTFQLTVIE